MTRSTYAPGQTWIFSKGQQLGCFGFKCYPHRSPKKIIVPYTPGAPLSVWKSPRYLSSLSRLLTRMVTIAGVLFGLATNTCARQEYGPYVVQGLVRVRMMALDTLAALSLGAEL